MNGIRKSAAQAKSAYMYYAKLRPQGLSQLHGLSCLLAQVPACVHAYMDLLLSAVHPSRVLSMPRPLDLSHQT